jgi:hypothetical protein
LFVHAEFGTYVQKRCKAFAFSVALLLYNSTESITVQFDGEFSLPLERDYYYKVIFSIKNGVVRTEYSVDFMRGALRVWTA